MALRYLVPGGDGNSNSTSNWSASSGGASGASVPSTNDDIIIDINSLDTPLTFNANMQVRSITVSDYIGTLTINSGITLTIFGNGTVGFILFNSNFTFTSVGSGLLRFYDNTASTCTINTGSVVLDCNVSFIQLTSAQQSVYTLQSNLTITKTLTFTPTNSQMTINGAFNINALGDVVRAATTANNAHFNYTSGNIIMNGTTPQTLNIQYTGTNVEFRTKVIFNSTSTITITGTARYFGLAYSPYQYIAGTVICDSNHHLLITGGDFVLDTSGINIILNRLTLQLLTISRTLTLQSDCFVKIIDGTVPTGGNPSSLVITIQSNVGGVGRKFVVMPDGSQSSLFRWLSTVDIDSTEGQTIWTFNGTNAPSRNWRIHNTQIRTVGKTFIG
jgi:hypothetical protein